jgi:hypothetical protein
MKITIESTTKIVELRTPSGTIPARIWEGTTDSGIPVHCYVTRIAVDKDHDSSQFDRELQEHQAPSAGVMAIPLRQIL